MTNRLALYKIPGVKSVSISVRLRAGSWFETGENWGLAHLLEHMLFQGTVKFPTKDEFDNYLEDNGIYMNAWTSGPAVHIFVKSPAERTKKAIVLINELLRNLQINQYKLDIEKKVVEREYADKWSRPENRFEKEVSNQLFGKGHKYTRDGVGVIEYVSNVSAGNLKSYYRDHLNFENAFIGVSGNVEKVEGLDVTKQANKVWNIDKTNPGDKTLVHYEDGLKSSTLVMSYFTKGMDSSDRKYRTLLSLISYTLAGSMRSILFKKIRNELGLAYSINSAVSVVPTTGVFQINTKVPVEKIDPVMQEVKKQISDYKKALTDEMFDRAKTYQKWQRTMAFDTPSNVAERLSSQLFWEDTTYSLEDEISMLETISKKEIFDVVDELFEGIDPYISIMRTR